MQRSFWKATADIWKRTAIRVITVCLGSGAAPVGHISADTLSTLFQKGSSMTTASLQYRESSTAIGCLPWKTPLTKSIPVIMKSGNNCVSRRKTCSGAFWSWLDQQKPVRNTRLDKAVNYVLNRRDIAETYLEDGRCSFTNNLSENAIRPFAVGRKNWLFSSSVDGANASAVVYTMVEMAKAHAEYLRIS